MNQPHPRRPNRGWYRASIGVLAVSGLLALMVWLYAYDNDNVPRTMAGGPHRKVNLLALKSFFTGPNKDAVFDRYDFRRLSQLTGMGVTSAGLEPGLGYAEGEKKGTFLWWITEGAYTADEPELYASFRHFYDPSQRHGAAYLTDHLDRLENYYQLLAGPLTKIVLGQNFNPHIDACSWAIEGEAGGGFGANTYCWNSGLDDMRRAFAEKGPGKDRLFVKAWRALGETMHLLTDMTCPPHVRDDSHPGKALGAAGFGNYNPNEGLLKNDPYESFCRESMVGRSAPAPLDPAAAGRIAGCATARDLFRELAAYTQEQFFSADTLSGTDHLGRAVTPGNELAPYPAPLLQSQDYDPKTGYYTQTVAGRPVRLAHETWLAATGWGAPEHAVRLSLPCVQDQANVLIPVAVAGCAKLLDWYVPKVEVRLDNFDAGKGSLEGTLDIHSSPAYPAPLVYNANDSQLFFFYINNGLQDWDKIKLELKDNRFTADVSKLVIRKDDLLRLELDIGGMRVRSEDFKVGEAAPQLTGSYRGTGRTVKINRDYILGRHLLPGNTEIEQMHNAATRHANQMTLDNLKWARVETDQAFHLFILDVQKNSGEAAALSGKLFIETGYVIVPNQWRPYRDKRHGEVQAKFGSDRFEVVRTQAVKEINGFNRYVFRVTGTLAGKEIRGQWSITENGAELYTGVYTVTKFAG